VDLWPGHKQGLQDSGTPTPRDQSISTGPPAMPDKSDCHVSGNELISSSVAALCRHSVTFIRKRRSRVKPQIARRGIFEQLPALREGARSFELLTGLLFLARPESEPVKAAGCDSIRGACVHALFAVYDQRPMVLAAAFR